MDFRTYIRLLMVMYKKQCANIKWNGETSSRFAIKNGVKQGAVLSAILFCVYIDELFPVEGNDLDAGLMEILLAY